MGIIEDQEVIDKILRHLGLWQTKQRPPRKPTKALELQLDYSDSQLPGCAETFPVAGPGGPWRPRPWGVKAGPRGPLTTFFPLTK